jgi:hypothetical protein
VWLTMLLYLRCCSIVLMYLFQQAKHSVDEMDADTASDTTPDSSDVVDANAMTDGATDTTATDTDAAMVGTGDHSDSNSCDEEVRTIVTTDTLYERRTVCFFV